MKVLFIGGSGLISTAVSHKAMNRSIDLTVLNRGSNNDVLPNAVKTVVCDITDETAVNEKLQDQTFDVVVDWIAFTVDDVKRSVRLFKDKTTQFVFISSASAYQKPLPFSPITEAVPLGNPYWGYSQNKEKCEAYLRQLDLPNFHVTIVRPSHTYDDRSLVFELHPHAHPFTMLKRMLEKKPFVIPGDGENLWTLTYNADFAEGFLDLLGNEQAYNDAFQLTSKNVYTWNEITGFIYDALGVEKNNLHIPLEFILSHFPEFEGELLGDKLANAVFDDAKIKAVAPNYQSTTAYRDIVKRAVTHYLENPRLQSVDDAFIKRYDAMIAAFLDQQ